MLGRALRAAPRSGFKPGRRSWSGASVASGVFLNWTAPTLDESGAAADIASYTVQYGAYLGDVLGSTTGISSSATSYNVALLAPSGTWWFQVFAVSSQGAAALIDTATAQKTIP